MQIYKEFQEGSAYESQDEENPSQEREFLDNRLDSICQEVKVETAFNFKPGMIISGKYELLEMLGYGAFGIVYKAKNILSENEEVAIKFPTMSDAKFERLCKEEQSLKKLVDKEFYHENIVKLVDVGSHEKIPYLVLEYIDGETFHKRIWEQSAKEKFIDFEEFLDIGIAVTDAVQYAHKNGVVHRDIKPANIMIDRNKQVKVTDFGLARDDYLESIIFSVSNPSMVGTPLYMAPEKKKGVEADAYSLAVTLFELLTNRRPDYSGTLPSEINKDVPKEIDKLYKKCVIFNPKERGTVKDIHDTLLSLKQAIEEKRQEERQREEEKRKREEISIKKTIDHLLKDESISPIQKGFVEIMQAHLTTNNQDKLVQETETERYKAMQSLEKMPSDLLLNGELSALGGAIGAFAGFVISLPIQALVQNFLNCPEHTEIYMASTLIGAALGAVGLWQTKEYLISKCFPMEKTRKAKQKNKVYKKIENKKPKQYKSTVDEIHDFLFK